MKLSLKQRVAGLACIGVLIILLIGVVGYYRYVYMGIMAGLTADEKGNLYLAMDRRVYKFDPSGKILLVVKGGLSHYLKVAVDRQENIYVADAMNSRLRKFNPNGKEAFSVRLASEFRTGRGWQDVFNVATDNKGCVWVCLTKRHRVRKFSPSGEMLLELGGESGKITLSYPNAVAFDKKGNLYIANTRSYSVDVLDENLNFLKSIPTRDLGEGNHPMPRSICVDSGGNIFVAAQDVFYREGAIYKLSPEGAVLSVFGVKEDEEFLPSDIALVGGRLYSIDRRQILLSVFDTTGKHSFFEPRSQLSTVLRRKRAFMKTFEHSPRVLQVLFGGLLIFVVILKIRERIAPARRFQEKEGREKGFSFYQKTYGLPNRPAMLVSVIMLIFTAGVGGWELLIARILFGGGYIRMAHYPAAVLIVPVVSAIIAVLLFWRLGYPGYLKVPAFLLMLSAALTLVDRTMRLNRMLDHIVFVVSSWMPVALFSSLILFLLVNGKPLRYRRFAVRIGEDGIRFRDRKSEGTIAWDEVQRVWEENWPYRAVVVRGISTTLVFDRFIERYEHLKSNLLEHTGMIKLRKNYFRRILAAIVLVFMFVQCAIPGAFLLHLELFSGKDWPFSKPLPFSFSVNWRDVYYSDEETFTIYGWLAAPRGAVMNVKRNSVALEPKEYPPESRQVPVSYPVVLEKGKNHIEVSVETPAKERKDAEITVIYDPELDYRRVEPVNPVRTADFASEDLDGDGVEEIVLVDDDGFLSVLEWQDKELNIVWQSIPVHYMRTIPSHSVERGYFPGHKRSGLLFCLGSDRPWCFLSHLNGEYCLEIMRKKPIILEKIPDTDGDGKNEYLRSRGRNKGMEIVKDASGELVPVLITPYDRTEFFIGDVNGSGIAEIYEFPHGYKVVIVREWKSGSHEPVKPDAPMQQIIAHIRGELGYGLSLGFQGSYRVMGDFDGDGDRELFVADWGGPACFLAWKENTYKRTELEVGEEVPKGRVIIAADIDGGRKDEIICPYGAFGIKDNMVELIEDFRKITYVGKKKMEYKKPPDNFAVNDYDGDGKAEIILLYDRYRRDVKEKVVWLEWENGQFLRTSLPLAAL